MHSCSNPYLASPDFLKTAFHVITAIATPIHAFGFYCIIRKTPQHMNPVKWLLFNLHCWCILLDVTISFLGIPYILFPAMAGYGLGPIESPGLFFYLGVTFVTGRFFFWKLKKIKKNWNKFLGHLRRFLNVKFEISIKFGKILHPYWLYSEKFEISGFFRPVLVLKIKI